MVDPKLLGPCGLYCGVCGVFYAQRDGNDQFREKLAGFYGVSADDLHCEGCMSDTRAVFCRHCRIRACCREKGYEGCHLCDDWPCAFVEEFPVPVGKQVILRAVPYWREVGTERYVADEEARYRCPHCGYIQFRGAKRCRECREPVDLD